VEDRLTDDRGSNAALTALGVVIVITAGWWALALWPAGEVPAEWLARTRGACFGARDAGLPSAGGWILLIGEPLGLFGLLFGVWGQSVASGLRRAWSRAPGRGALLAVAGAVLVGVVATGARVVHAYELRDQTESGAAVVVTVPDVVLPATDLVDQRGVRAPLAGGAPIALMTFAFGHCATVCPVTVHDLLTLRDDPRWSRVPLVVVTLDPWRDSPELLPSIAERWGLSSHDRLLSGHVAEVTGTLDALRVGRTRNERTGDIDHVATVLLLAGDTVIGRVEGGARRELLRAVEALLVGAGA
jgi:cytochrome oxidase Cu insertion factor (SCO1/SenC/PrrC family)